MDKTKTEPEVETPHTEIVDENTSKSFFQNKRVQIWTAVIGGVLFAILLLVVVLYFATTPTKKTTIATVTPTSQITITDTPTPTEIIDVTETPIPTLQPTST